VLRLHPGNLGQASSDELMYWSQYQRARGFRFESWGKGRRLSCLTQLAGGRRLDPVNTPPVLIGARSITLAGIGPCRAQPADPIPRSWRTGGTHASATMQDRNVSR
jgi:hypothetical protein